MKRVTKIVLIVGAVGVGIFVGGSILNYIVFKKTMESLSEGLNKANRDLK